MPDLCHNNRQGILSDSPMKLEAKNVQMVFRDVQVDNNLLLDEIAIHAEGPSLVLDSGTSISARNTGIHVILSETRMNDWMKLLKFGNVSNLQITVNAQSVTFTGKYNLFRSMKAPFQLDAYLVIDSQSLIKINPIALKCFGFQLPQGATEIMVRNINLKMKELIDLKGLPFPVEMKSVDIHPGRLDIICETSIVVKSVKSIAPMAAITP